MNLPNKFTFDTLFSVGGKYTAEKLNNGDFDVSWKSESGRDSRLYTFRDVKTLIDKKDWNIVKVVKQPSFSIKEGQIEAAAKFIVANNSYMYNKTVSYMIDQIKNDIRRQIEKIKAGKEAWYCGTAGYIITIFLEDEDYYVVDVLVDPSVSQDKEFVNVEDML